MTTVGIVAEYNPFHLGHEKQFRLLRRRFGADAAIVCIMSGNFVQRGEPALFDKFVRAQAAVRCGADLVVELPLTVSIASAEGFAYGAVESLHRMGVVEALCFGSERADAAALMETARRLLAPSFSEALKAQLETGCSYAAAREAALDAQGGDGTLLRRPNDILAVEYCKALLRLQSPLVPAVILRRGDYHSRTAVGENPSATAVRRMILSDGPWQDAVPPAAAAVFAAAPRHCLEYGQRAMLARLRALTDAEFQALPFGGEGLWSKVMKACRRESSVAAILEAAKSKRYAHSRLRRMLLCGYLGISREMLAQTPPALRALAFTARGAGLLKRARREGSIPVLNAGAPGPDAAYEALERRAADLYTLFCREEGAMACGTERAGRIFFWQDGEKT